MKNKKLELVSQKILRYCMKEMRRINNIKGPLRKDENFEDESVSKETAFEIGLIEGQYVALRIMDHIKTIINIEVG